MATLTSQSTYTVPAVHDDGTGPLFEIVDGERVEKSMSMKSQWVGMRLAACIDVFIQDEDVGGWVVTETFIACFEWMPNTKRRPDVAYWRDDQLPDGLPDVGDTTVAPAWAVEVVSPNDNISDLNVKLGEYFRAGVLLVWVVDPQSGTIRTEQPDGTAHVYRRGETISAAPVLPGFSVLVDDLFPRQRESAQR